MATESDSSYTKLTQHEDENPPPSDVPDEDSSDLFKYPGQELGRVQRRLVNGGFDNKFDDEMPPPKGVGPKLPYRQYVPDHTTLSPLVKVEHCHADNSDSAIAAPPQAHACQWYSSILDRIGGKKEN